MRKRSKFLVGGVAIAAILAIAGIAYAAFQYTPIASAVGQGETFNPTTVSVTGPSAHLLPGETAGVTLVLNNPAGNANAKVTSITPLGVDVVQDSTQGNSPEDKTYCEGQIELSAPAAGQVIVGGASANVAANIKFKDTMDIRCEGIDYTAKWTVTFQAVR
jgi:hypothetical protein